MSTGDLPDFVAYCLELMEASGPVRAKRMFGGWGLFSGPLMFGLIADETLYLKVDDLNRAEFEAAGSGPFVYTAKGRSVALGYFQVPPDAMEDRHAMRPWAQSAMDAAARRAQHREVKYAPKGLTKKGKSKPSRAVPKD